MQRLNLANLLDRIEGGDANECMSNRGLTWRNALLMAHVETNDGPDLQVVREDVGNEAILQIHAGNDDLDQAEAIAIIEENELIISLRTSGDPTASDASIMIGFTNEHLVGVALGAVERDPVPAVVLRNYEQGEIHVLDETTRSVQLAPGSWTIQAASAPDGSRRSGSLEFLPRVFPGDAGRTHG